MNSDFCATVCNQPVLFWIKHFGLIFIFIEIEARGGEMPQLLHSVRSGVLVPRLVCR